MQVPRKAVLAVFAALEFGSAESWAPNRLQKKVDTFKDYVAESDIEAKIKDEKLAKLARKMLTDKIEVKADEEAETADDNGGAADDAAGDTTADDGEGEGEEEKPTSKPEKGSKPKADKPAKAPKPKKEKPVKEKKVSMLDAAEQVLEAVGKPLTTQELIMEMDSRELWTSPNGKTPAATLYVRMYKEEQTKGRLSRFKKVGPNQFALAKNVKGKGKKDESDDEE